MIEEKFEEQFEEVANPREFCLGFFLIKIFLRKNCPLHHFSGEICKNVGELDWWCRICWFQQIAKTLLFSLPLPHPQASENGVSGCCIGQHGIFIKISTSLSV
jgi:hypothetical protein